MTEEQALDVARDLLALNHDVAIRWSLEGFWVVRDETTDEVHRKHYDEEESER